MSKKATITTILIALIIVFTPTVFAMNPEYAPRNAAFTNIGFNGDGTRETIVILQILASALLYFAAPVAVIMLIKGGFDFVIGGAESEQIDTAKKHLTWTILGLLLIIFSYSIVRAVIQFTIDSAESANTVEEIKAPVTAPPTQSTPPSSTSPRNETQKEEQNASEATPANTKPTTGQIIQNVFRAMGR